MSLAMGLYQRWRHLAHEIAKFGIVGFINTVIDFGIANWLQFGFEIGPLKAKLVSTVVAVTSSYFMNRHWTFRHRARTGIRREYALFFGLNAVGLAIAEACVAFVYYGIDQRGVVAYNLAQVAGLLIGMVFRFLSYKRWVFLPAEASAELVAAGGSVAAPEADVVDLDPVPVADEPTTRAVG